MRGRRCCSSTASTHHMWNCATGAAQFASHILSTCPSSNTDFVRIAIKIGCLCSLNIIALAKIPILQASSPPAVASRWLSWSLARHKWKCAGAILHTNSSTQIVLPSRNGPYGADTFHIRDDACRLKVTYRLPSFHALNGSVAGCLVRACLCASACVRACAFVYERACMRVCICLRACARERPQVGRAFQWAETRGAHRRSRTPA